KKEYLDQLRSRYSHKLCSTSLDEEPEKLGVSVLAALTVLPPNAETLNNVAAAMPAAINDFFVLVVILNSPYIGCLKF
ncbi:hypothetical protein, partial [Lacticaseibacillus sp. 53-4]|uniref:hypothetical protein n=1 Tax=Lacticaseibacillus sp. 53-4 TaxID=2799575 RepID=UPI0019410CBD